MMKAVNSALNANYSGKAWLKWFTTTAKAVIAELDASSATDGSVTGSAMPGDASKGEISDIKAELRKLLDDAANDDMGYADMMKAVNSALNANYSGKAWLKWFTSTAKAVIAELDASSA